MASLDVAWIHGAPEGLPCQDPPLQVHRVDEATYVLRQSKALTYEGAFLYLLLGSERALLLDTGDVADPAVMPLRVTVDSLLDQWLVEHPRERYPLVVAHSHAHGDHVRGDAQLASRTDTSVVGHSPQEVSSYFGFASWPRETVSFELGGRRLEVTGVPGHEASSIAVYDPLTGFLLTGDTVCRGRLYVEDPAAFRATLDSLVAVAESRPVTAVVGCHIEMTRTPGVDYPRGTTYQPDEPRLDMTVEELVAVRDAAHQVGDAPGTHMFDAFSIVNGQ
ncbi:MAG: MBL fold metallo-hydrolase [Pedococcus sp.]